MNIDILRLHNVIFINRGTIETRKKENESQVDETKDVKIDKNPKRAMPDVGSKHKRDVRSGNPKPSTKRQRHVQAVGSELQEYVAHTIVNHFDEENRTLNRVWWLHYSAKNEIGS